MSNKLQLQVDYFDGTSRYYPITFGIGWRIDTMTRMLVIGTGIPRTHIPLDSVAAFHAKEIDDGTT